MSLSFDTYTTIIAKQTQIKGELLSSFLNCVKQCQVRYGGKTELASEKDHQVAELCSSLEAVLSHGLRHTPITNQLSNSTLRQVSQLITTRIHIGDTSQVFWHYVILFLTPHERERYAVLKNIKTDEGRGRSWIRGSLNEHTLERYFHYMLEDSQLLCAYYEDWALMRDAEKSCMFPNMVAGLSSILFAINIDNINLNYSDMETKSFLKNIKNEPIIITRIIDGGGSDLTTKRQRKVATQIITFDEDVDDRNLVTVSMQETNTTLDDNKSDQVSVSSGTHTSSEPPSEPECSVNDYNTTILFQENVDKQFESNDEILTPIKTTHHDADDEEINNDSEQTSDESIQVLKREIETLKSQLKKYIGAVQMLNCNRTEAIHTLNIQNQSNKEINEAKHYEAKLIQVAEMHAELMEFNEYLQHQINFKDKIIERLKNQLVSNGHNIESYNDSVHVRGEVFVSIPSAFLTGVRNEEHGIGVYSSNSSKSYHIYQIHLRAGNHEWNIFRRYSHFHALHKQLKKIDPVVGTFNFPPKKTLGNKDLALVEKRRKMLEAYLRRLFKHWPELGACTSRAALEQYLAFFREPIKFDEIKSGDIRL